MRAAMLLVLLLAGCATSREARLLREDERLMGDDVATVDASPAPPAAGVNVVSVVEAPAPPPYAGPDYFPASLALPSLRCEVGRGAKPQPVLTQFERQWYSRQLAAAGEPSLLGNGERPRADGPRTVRFTWLPSFSAPIVIRVERDASGAGRLVAKVLSGAGGYPPGEVVKTIDRPLTRAEGARLEAALVRTHLFDLPPASCEMGLDGEQWIFESADARGYRFVDRWTPRKGPAFEVGRTLMALTGWKLDAAF